MPETPQRSDSERAAAAEEFLALNDELQYAAHDVKKYLEQLKNPIGTRNFTDRELDMGKSLHEIIESDLETALDELAEIARKRKEWKQKHLASEK